MNNIDVKNMPIKGMHGSHRRSHYINYQQHFSKITYGQCFEKISCVKEKRESSDVI